MKSYLKIFFTILMVCSLINTADARKIKQSLVIEKGTGDNRGKGPRPQGVNVKMNDFFEIDSVQNPDLKEKLRNCSFSGYDKEPNSNIESFIIVNNSDLDIKGFAVRIDYYDMKGRKLHSRVIEEVCEVPAGENRRTDVKSWDKQHTYYYHLGNEPKRVATPFDVKFTPVEFWVSQD